MTQKTGLFDTPASGLFNFPKPSAEPSQPGTNTTNTPLFSFNNLNTTQQSTNQKVENLGWNVPKPDVPVLNQPKPQKQAFKGLFGNPNPQTSSSSLFGKPTTTSLFPQTTLTTSATGQGIFKDAFKTKNEINLANPSGGKSLFGQKNSEGQKPRQLSQQVPLLNPPVKQPTTPAFSLFQKPKQSNTQTSLIFGAPKTVKTPLFGTSIITPVVANQTQKKQTLNQALAEQKKLFNTPTGSTPLFAPQITSEKNTKLFQNKPDEQFSFNKKVEKEAAPASPVQPSLPFGIESTPALFGQTSNILIEGSTNKNSNQAKPNSLFGNIKQREISEPKIQPPQGLFGNSLQTPNVDKPQPTSLFTPPLLNKNDQIPSLIQEQKNRKTSIQLKNPQKKVTISIPNNQASKKPQQQISSNLKSTNLEQKAVQFPINQTKSKVGFSLPPEENNADVQIKAPKTLQKKVSQPTSSLNIHNVQANSLASKKVVSDEFISCKQIFNTISRNRNNKQQLKQFLMQKQVRELLTFSQEDGFILTGQNFKISSKAIPKYEETNINLKRYIFDLICYFKQISKYSDWKCLNIINNFFSDVKYHEQFRLSTLEPNQNYFHSKAVYEIGQTDIARLSIFSQQIKKIMEMLIDQQIIMNSLLCQSMLIIQQSFTKGEFSKIFDKKHLLERYFKKYFQLILKSEESSEELGIYFQQKTRLQVKIFSQFLVYFVESSQAGDIITYELLKQIITNFDEYVDSKNAIDDIVSKKSEIQRTHQHMLLILLQFDKIKKKQNSVFNKYSMLEETLQKTKSQLLLPFKQVVHYIKKIQEQGPFQEENIPNSKQHIVPQSESKKILSQVDGPEWKDWIQIFLRKQKLSSSEYQYVTDAFQKIYVSDQALNQLFRQNKFQQYIHPIFKLIEVLRKNRNHNILYRIYRVLLGSQTLNYSQEVIIKYIRDQEWSEYILKPMLLRSREATHNNTFQSQSSKDVDAKIMFLLKCIRLNPKNLKFYSQRLFRNEGYNHQIITFILDCLYFCTLQATKNYRLATQIFTTLNRLLIFEETYKDLLFCINLYHSMNTNNDSVHWLLKFIPDLKKSDTNDARSLKQQIKNHIEILLSYQQILLLCPEVSDFAVSQILQSYRQRYSTRDLWSNLKRQKVPGSPWIRSVASILNDSSLDYRVIGNIVRLLSFKSCESYTNQVPYLNFLKDILNQLPIVEKLIGNVERDSLQSISILLSKKQMYDIIRQKNKQKMKQTQDALYLLQTLLDLMYGFNQIKKQTKFQNYYFSIVSNLKCLYNLQGIIDSYFCHNHEQKYIHPLVNLFGLINFQAQRLLPLTNNPTLYKADYKSCVLPIQLKNQSLRIDYNYIMNPLGSPSSKQYLCIQSISINILKVLTLLVTTYQSNLNLNEYFKRSIGTGEYQLVLTLLSQALENFQSSRQQSIAALQFINVAVKHQYKFIESFIVKNQNQSTSFFSFLDEFLKIETTDIGILQKIIEVVLTISKRDNRKIINDKFNQKDYKLLFLKKLKSNSFNNIKRLQSIVRKNSSTELLERIFIYRNILNHGRFLYSLQMLTEMTLLSIFKKEKPIKFLQDFFKFVSQKNILSTTSRWQLLYSNQIERVSPNSLQRVQFPIKNYFTESILFNHFGNFRNDVYQTHLLNSIYQEESIYRHLKAYQNNVYSFMKQVSFKSSRLIYNLFIVVMNCGTQGYVMSTQPRVLAKDDVVSKLYCQFHQPKIAFAFLDIFNQNQDHANTFLKNILKVLVDDLYSISPRCSYVLCLQLISTFIHLVRSFSIASDDIKESLVNLISHPEWISQNDQQMEPLIVSPIVGKIVLQILSLIRETKLQQTSQTLKKIGVIVSRSLAQTNLVAETKNNLLMCLLLLIKFDIPIGFDPIELLAQYNSTYFYSVMRILIEYSHKNSLSLVQRGVVSTLCKHSILSSINNSISFYSETSRNQAQISWVWALNLIRHIIIQEGSNSLVVNQALKFLQHFNIRILCILDEPVRKDFMASYGYLEQLQVLLKILNTFFRTSKNMSISTKQYLERLQYSLLHNTIRIFDYLQNAQIIESWTASEAKLKLLTPFKQPLQKVSNVPNVFSMTLQSMLTSCLFHFSGLLQTSLSTSEFVKWYFQKSIQGSNIIYTNYFWLFTNRNIHHLQQDILGVLKTIDGWSSNSFRYNQGAWKSPQLFSTNGYLTCIKSFVSHQQQMSLLVQSSLGLSRVCLMYYQHQVFYRQKYLSLVPQDIEDFRSQQVKFIKMVLSTNRGKRGGQVIRMLSKVEEQLSSFGTKDLIYI